MSEILRKVQQFRAGLLLRESFAQKQMLESYEQSWRAIETEIARLVALSRDAENPASINEEIERLRSLKRQVFEAVRELGIKAAEIAEAGQREFAERATRHARELMELNQAANSASVTGSFNTLARGAVEQFIGASADGSPLKDSFDALAQSLGLETGQVVRRAVIRGLTLGMNPVDVARMVRREADAKGANPQRAGAVVRRLNLAMRTEMFRAYRESSRATYQANKAVKGWRWVAKLDPTTCVLCWARHGKIFPSSVPMQTHIACRCVMIPVTDETVKFESGDVQFKKLETGVQRDILGDKAYDAYERGEVTLNDFIGERQSDKWGVTLYRRSLKEIQQGKVMDAFGQPDNVQIAFGTGGRETLETLLGGKASEPEVASLFGALDNSRVRVEQRGDKVFAQVSHSYVKQQDYFVARDDEGKLLIHIDWVEKKKDAPRGVMFESFARQAMAAQRAGVHRLTAYAAGTPKSAARGGLSGFLVWALYGFDANLTTNQINLLPEALKAKGVKTLNQLMLSGGRDFWVEKGDEHAVTFDLARDSSSWQVLMKYVSAKGKRK